MVSVAEVLREALGDAYDYRLGEASGLEDPDLDPGDREALERYLAVAITLGWTL